MTTVQEMTQTVSAPIKAAPRPTTKSKPQPFYNVILMDDDDHTFDYVIGMLRKLFGFTVEQSFQLADSVDSEGRVIVDTTTLERAELKRDQIHAFGRDWRITRCAGSMSAALEPVE